MADMLTGIEACVFDAYGTLFDFSSAAAGCADLLGDKAEALTLLWRDKQLQYTWLRAVQGRHADFWQVTGDALDFALARLDLKAAGLRDRLMNLYLTLDPFPEVVELLRRLKAGGRTTAILSNGSPAMLRAAVDNAGIAGLLDFVLSVEEVGVYKPTSGSTSLPSIGWELHPARSLFSPPAPGTPMPPRPLGCRFSGATAMASRASTCRAPDREIRNLAELPALIGA